MTWISSTTMHRLVMAAVAAGLVVAALGVAEAVPSGATVGQRSPDSRTGLAPTTDEPGDSPDPAVPALVFEGFSRSRNGRLTAVTVPRADWVPSALVGGSGTLAGGNNNRGDVVGAYTVGGALRGFLLEDDEFTTIDFPGAAQTSPVDINNLGQITGSYVGSDGNWHGFIRSKRGRFTSFDFPASARTAPHKINDRGEIVGLWSADGGIGPYQTGHGFLRDRRGRLTTIDVPGAASVTDAQGINDQRDVVGAYDDEQGTIHGFLMDRRGRFTTIDLPGAFTSILGVNNQRQMVGNYGDSEGNQRGFVRHRSGRFEPIDIDGAFTTVALDINDRREIDGFSAALADQPSPAPNHDPAQPETPLDPTNNHRTSPAGFP